MPPTSRRSVLYVPASRAGAVAKAAALPVDAVILDLEDAVAPEAKDAARGAAVAALRAGFGAREVVLRVNGASSAWHAADLAAAAAARPDAVLVPKVEAAADLAAVAAALAAAGWPDAPLWAMIETPRGVIDAPAIAGRGRAHGLGVLVAGPNDLAAGLRVPDLPGRPGLVPHLAAIVLAARAIGLDALDGPFGRLGDPEGLAAECAQGRALGFDGKTLIHPGQVAAANAAFGPSPEALEEAAALVAAFEAPGAALGAVRFRGRMAERLHLAAARRALALGAAIAAREAGGARS